MTTQKFLSFSDSDPFSKEQGIVKLKVKQTKTHVHVKQERHQQLG